MAKIGRLVGKGMFLDLAGRLLKKNPFLNQMGGNVQLV